jgi:glycosyltransferase involved in cell wall biosynthesis
VFVFVGRLVADKGINELVEAFGRLEEEEIVTWSYNCKLLLVGPTEAELDPLLPKTLKSIEENPNIICVGFQNDVRPYFAIADALVFPSYREGFPNVVLQAGAMGLPSIVSDINGCNEIIINGNNGLIIPVKNTDAVFEAMKKYIIDKQVYQLHKKNARNRIAENYEQSVVWNAILNEYKSLEKYV